MIKSEVKSRGSKTWTQSKLEVGIRELELPAAEFLISRIFIDFQTSNWDLGKRINMAWDRIGISLKWNYSWFHIRFDYQNFIGSFKSKASAWKSIWDSQSLIFKSGKINGTVTHILAHLNWPYRNWRKLASL